MYNLAHKSFKNQFASIFRPHKLLTFILSLAIANKISMLLLHFLVDWRKIKITRKRMNNYGIFLLYVLPAMKVGSSGRSMLANTNTSVTIQVFSHFYTIKMNKNEMEKMQSIEGHVTVLKFLKNN